MPQPRVYWLRGSQVLQSDTDVLVTSEGHLLIGQARPQDSGNYTCVAENIAAKRIAPVSQIIVYGKYRGIRISCFRGNFLVNKTEFGYYGDNYDVLTAEGIISMRFCNPDKWKRLILVE